jgi:hypothetical protein
MLILYRMIIFSIIAIMSCSAKLDAKTFKMHKYLIHTQHLEPVEDEFILQETDSQTVDNNKVQNFLGCSTPIWAMCQVKIAHHDLH